MTCNNCGAQVSANDGCCPECGAPVTASQMNTNSEMFCQNCGTQIYAGDTFCPNCGRPTNGEASPWETPGGYPPPVKKKSQAGLIVLIVTLLVLIVAALGFFAYMWMSDDYNVGRNTENTHQTSGGNGANGESGSGNPSQETAVPTPTPIPPPVFTDVYASSTRNYDIDESNNYVKVYYYPSFARDGRMDTAWTPNRNYDYNPYITITANEPQYVRGIRMTNGYCKSDRTYRKNKRITRARISYNGGEKEANFDLESYGRLIEVDFGELVKTDYITISVLNTVDGGWHDIAISEIEVY